MSTAPFIDRLLHRRPAATPALVRIEVQPPQLWQRPESFWSMALRWIAGRDGATPELRTPLEKARSEFVAALDGLLDVETADLLRRAQHARSLRELWHLRSELYTLIARRLNEVEARLRLDRVNLHFPTRARTGSGSHAPSGFGATGPSAFPESTHAARDTV